MNVVLTADVGSTFTKLTAVDVGGRRIVGTAKAFTTIETNVMEGFDRARAELAARCGRLEFRRILACSSAAGGLKMIAVGLVPDLTVQAARLASANAGAKILKAYAYELSRAETAEIAAARPDMIMLSGGLDGGNKEVIIHNAGMLASSGLDCSIVAAGNKSAVDAVREAFKGYEGDVIYVDNVMPELGALNIEPAQKAIRDLFIRNIISAKGLDDLQRAASSEIMPTPRAVFQAVRLLSRGAGELAGLGDLMAVDVGGATTDVYSMADGLPQRANVFLQGLRQPWAKRTVEGDLGLRYSLASLAEGADLEELAGRTDASAAEVADWLAVCRRSPETLPQAGSPGQALDEELAARAVKVAAARHCGTLEPVYTAEGRFFAQKGKDLSAVATVVGTGGPIIQARDPLAILGAAVYEPADLNSLKPRSPRLLVDRRYILAAMGLLSGFEPEAALGIMLEQW